MTLQEFETMTKFHPSCEMFEVISEEYVNCSDDKQTFCKAYAQDKDGLASKIQRKATLKNGDRERAHEAELKAKDAEIERLQNEMEQLKKKIISDAILQQIGQHFTQEGNDLYDNVSAANELILEYCEEPDSDEFKAAVDSRKRMNARIRECNIFVDAISRARLGK